MDINVNRKIHWFYRCVECGLWTFANKRIKRKKCLNCKRSFKFEHSIKFKEKTSKEEAIAIVKHLKERDAKEEFGFFIPKLKEGVEI